jgi:hypothetical protein
MAKVVAFHGGAVAGEPSREIVETLSDLLERAKRGEISAIAYATIAPSGSCGTGWDGIQGTRNPLSSVIMMLQHRYAAALLQPESEK